jgi:hypothetical protein
MRRQPTRTVRLSCRTFWIDVRVTVIRRRWLASADTPYGPSLGLGLTPAEALIGALEPFEDATEELLESVPEALWW